MRLSVCNNKQNPAIHSFQKTHLKHKHTLKIKEREKIKEENTNQKKTDVVC